MPSLLISQFDTWRPGYGSATVRVEIAGTDTLASIFTDENLSIAAANPQTLASKIVDGIDYGKFSAPLYVGVAYELKINSIDQTGVMRPPFSSLDGVDVSLATVQVAGGTQDIELEDHLARRLDVRDFGAFVAVGGAGASSSTNNATLTAGMAAVSSLGGGYLELPAGSYDVTAFTIPTAVVLRGVGRVGTTLRSTVAGAVATIGGVRAGMVRMTLDGVSKVASGVGLYSTNKDEIVLTDVEFKRFDTGVFRAGGTRSEWLGVYISDCANGYTAYGQGAALRFNTWHGGKIELCSTTGIDLTYVDATTEHNLFSAITFDTNTSKAVWIRGARWTSFRDCRWISNTNNLTVADISPATPLKTVIGLNIDDGEMSSGTLTLGGNLEEVVFRRMALTSIAVTLTAPAHNVLVEDCRETSVTVAGDTTAWRRHTTPNVSAAALVTTDATFTKAWAATLNPGQHVILSGRVQARRRNGIDYASVINVGWARRPGSTLLYQTQTGNFTVGNVLTGGTSGATARIVADTDAGATGTLTLYDVVGTFVNGELITDGSGGSATTNGTVTAHNVTINNITVLNYDGQTVNFTAGNTLTGGTSGATATIVSDVDAGATGTLTIKDVTGIFIDNEAITGSGGGAAVVNGDWVQANVISSAASSGGASYSSTYIASGDQVAGYVRGVAGHTIEWIFDVDVMSNP